MKFILVISFLFCSCIAFSQSYLGYISDNYSGLHSLTVNPANSADSRMKLDINLVSAGSLITNDYTYFSFSNINEIIEGEELDNIVRFPSNSNEAFADFDVLGPSFMLSIANKQGVGIVTRVRALNTYRNINGNLLEAVINSFPDENFAFEQQNLNAITHIWGEVGFVYGRTLIDTDRQLLKAGVTLKYLLGAGVAETSSNNLAGSYSFNNNTVDLNGDLSYLITYEEEQSADEFLNDLTGGFGLDLGASFELKDKNAGLRTNVHSDYKLRLGVALLDVGSITYKDKESYSYTLNAVVDADQIEEDFEEAIQINFEEQITRGDYKVKLPASLRFTADYKVTQSLYINLDMQQRLVNADLRFNSANLNRITLTPRYESRLFGFYLPITHTTPGNLFVGSGFRLGPLFVGSSTLWSTLLSDTSSAINGYIGFKIPIKRKKF
ncbi:DUF5723 family protein [Croceivirga lutea]|uniref:DUF5723 family protein n=1 Tax=Croceivirga lutea TaxID=1775167 RepID=UPI00163A172B|nr:DUF5723 family protein [Croceivirga lutea]